MTITFDGYSLRSYVDKINDIRRPIMPRRDHTLVDIPGMAGAIIARSKSGVKTIEVDVQIFGDTKAAIRTKVEALAAVLFTEEPAPLIFADDPNKTYYAIVSDETTFEELARIGKATIIFLCPDPYPVGLSRNKTTGTTVTTADFTSKVAGSSSVNPNRLLNRQFAGLSVPSGFSTEVTQAAYNNVTALNGTYASYSTTTNGNIAQFLVHINMILEIKRKYGLSVPGVNNAERSAWLKKAITQIVGKAWAYGTAPTNITNWRIFHAVNNAWDTTIISHALTTPQLMQRTTTAISNVMDGSGMVYFLLDTNASNGTTASAVYLDDVEIDVTMDEDMFMEPVIGGNAPTLPIFTVTFGASATFYEIANGDGEKIRVIYNFVSGDELVVDHVNNLVTINGTVNNQTITVDSDFFKLKPGTNELIMNHDATTNPTISFDYNERWLS
jgi:predicted phage tail component-like protein